MMFRKQITIAVAALGLIAAAIPATSAALNQPGVAQPGPVTCRLGRIDVTAPNIEPSVATGIVGGSQTTAFRSVLKRWYPTQRAWLPVRRSPYYYHEADGLVIPPEVFQYIDPASGAWRSTSQGPSFSMVGRSGYFSVTFEFYWLDYVNGRGTGMVLGRRLMGPGEVFDERPSSYGRTRGYCRYR
jgi:hypothetical protein